VTTDEIEKLVDELEYLIENDPTMRDHFELSRKFSLAVRKHFKGRAIDPIKVIHASASMVGVNLRQLPAKDRDAIARQVVDQLAFACTADDDADGPAQ
jgi:hypothetical protein